MKLLREDKELVQIFDSDPDGPMFASTSASSGQSVCGIVITLMFYWLGRIVSGLTR